MRAQTMSSTTTPPLIMKPREIGVSSPRDPRQNPGTPAEPFTAPYAPLRFPRHHQQHPIQPHLAAHPSKNTSPPPTPLIQFFSHVSNIPAGAATDSTAHSPPRRSPNVSASPQPHHHPITLHASKPPWTETALTALPIAAPTYQSPTLPPSPNSAFNDPRGPTPSP